MSPEVLQGSGYDFKSDVWSLGCVTYELCALKSPFKNDSDQKMSLYDLFQKINKGNH
jgi:serine/threonine protein kinase